MCHIRYEDLLLSVSDSINAVSEFLHISPAYSKKEAYVIPESERSIHKLVIENEIVQDRSRAWMKELSRIDRLRIEAVCDKEMTRLEYAKTEDIGYVRGLILCLSEIPAVIFKFMRHAYLVLQRTSAHYKKAGKKFES